MNLLRRSLFSFRFGKHHDEPAIVVASTIPEAKPGMQRRDFLKLMAAAPVVLASHRVIFDMAPKLWTPEPVAVRIATLEELNRITQKYFDKVIGDAVFAPSPTFWGMKRQEDGTVVGEEVLCDPLGIYPPAYRPKEVA